MEEASARPAGTNSVEPAASTSAPNSRSTSPARRQGSVPLASQLPTSRVGECRRACSLLVPYRPATPQQHGLTADRLLLQRLRKSQSGTALYKEAQVVEEQQERFLSQPESEGSQRLLVVANRLPVSAYRDKDGRWQLQVEHLPDEEVVCAYCCLVTCTDLTVHPPFLQSLRSRWGVNIFATRTEHEHTPPHPPWSCSSAAQAVSSDRHCACCA